MEKITKDNLYKADVIAIYKMVLRGDRKKFPNGFWQLPDGLDNAKICTKFLIEDILNYDTEDLKENLSLNTFRDHKLGGMLAICFNDSPYTAINFVYPDAIHAWELKITTSGYWEDKENCLKALKWLFEDKLKLSREDLKKKLSYDLIVGNGFSRMMQLHFNDCAYNAINALYPGEFHEWEFNMVQKGFWKNKDNGIRAGRWLIEDVLKLDDDALKKELSADLFRKHGLGNMLYECFGNSPYKLINTLYPGKFKEWEFNTVPREFWQSKENGVKATKWLFQDILKMDVDEIKETVSTSTFYEHGLSRMLIICFDGDVYKALNSVYPNTFKYGDLKRCKK